MPRRGLAPWRGEWPAPSIKQAKTQFGSAKPPANRIPGVPDHTGPGGSERKAEAGSGQMCGGTIPPTDPSVQSTWPPSQTVRAHRASRSDPASPGRRSCHRLVFTTVWLSRMSFVHSSPSKDAFRPLQQTVRSQRSSINRHRGRKWMPGERAIHLRCDSSPTADTADTIGRTAKIGRACRA
jgi:hypothetical protein